MQTVIGAFDDRKQAQGALDRLLQSGFRASDVHIEQQDPGSSRAANDAPQSEERRGFFASLFGTEDQANTGHAHTYDEAVRRGSAVVVVDAQDEAQADRACELLHDAGAVDVDERSRQWRSEGWTGGGQAAGMQDRQALAGGGQSPGNQGRQTLTGGGAMGGRRDDSPPAGKEGVVDVVQEELRVGKRSLDRGGVRVIQRVSEKPVHEVVKLREEHASVDRRPVDRPATPGDMDVFHEGTLEVRETAEEAVVDKKARVVEEVRVSKEVREREETIDDTVRRKDVDVERIEGNRGGATRERAVASDRNDPVHKDRDPGAAGLSGSTANPRKRT